MLFRRKPEQRISILVYADRLWVGHWMSADEDRWLLHSVSNQAAHQILVVEGVVYNLYRACELILRAVRDQQMNADCCVVNIDGQECQAWSLFQSQLVAKNIGIALYAHMINCACDVQNDSLMFRSKQSERIEIEELLADKQQLPQYIQYRDEILLSARLLHTNQKEEV